MTDPDAYAVYAAVLPRVWADVSKNPLLLQRETEPIDGGGELATGCLKLVATQPGWAEVVKNFIDANAYGPMRLDTTLPLDSVYHFISRAEIEADDLRLSSKYPGQSQSSRPESIEYAAVSPIGFNVTKTRAIVYTRTRTHRGEPHVLVLRDGQWVPATFPFGCFGGVAD